METPGATTSREPASSVLGVLRALLADFEDRDTVLELVSQLVAQNEEMTLRLARVASRFKKSEKVSLSQLMLFLDALEQGEEEPSAEGEKTIPSEEVAKADNDLRAAADIAPTLEETMDAAKTRAPHQPPVRKPAPEHLPRKDNPISVPAEERACPRCGGERVCIGHEVNEVIELVPARVIVRRDLREKLACRPCEGQIVCAPAGDKVVDSGKFGLALVGNLLVEKYADGLPLHRQRERLRRLGLDVAISTLADQVTWCTDLLRPLWRASLVEVVNARVMHLDATGLPVLDRNVRGKTRLGTLWGYVGTNEREAIAAYLYNSTGKKVAQRSGELGPEEVLALREGPTVADASNLFDKSFRREAIIECGCNMHARRYFVKALDAGDARAALAIAAYRKLYAIEDELRSLDPTARLAARRERAKPVFEELAHWCRVRKAHEPPSSGLGKALQYFTNQQIALGRFLDDGCVPMDNGIVERLHIRTALTRKNFLFAGSDAGGERAAIAYTILGSCRLAGVDPIEYLADVLPILTRSVRLRDLPALLPSRWAARKAAEPESTSSA